MLQLIDVSLSFNAGGDFNIINKLSMDIDAGEFVSIIGPNGCGKTSLLYLISGFYRPSSGKILFDGSPVQEPGRDRIMLFQDYVLFPWKSVIGNVLLGLSKCDVAKKERLKIAQKYLELVNLANYANWPIYRLSGGMQQRVALARSLVVNPKILLLDEPFSALDPFLRHYFATSLYEFQTVKNTTILVTHNIKEAILLSDTIYVLSGRPATIQKICRIQQDRRHRAQNRSLKILCHDIKQVLIEEYKKPCLVGTSDVKC
jgi:NitT/TauT family transport system ATP-binding protein